MDVEIRDKRLHEMLLQAEIEDCALLDKQISRYLQFWRVVAHEDVTARVVAQSSPTP